MTALSADRPIESLVVVGGGSAGWLTAGIVAAELRRQGSGIRVSLVESPDVSPIGVGEGTWPTMRASLIRMGISETEFFRCCDASYKQGTQFVDWLRGEGPRTTCKRPMPLQRLRGLPLRRAVFLMLRTRFATRGPNL